jgi:cystathionine beta-lyase/cystathionine gamma-synthase
MTESYVFRKDGGYARSYSDRRLELSSILEKRYAAKKAFILPSGMSAISVIMNTLCGIQNSKIDLILYSSELYCDTPNLIKFIAKLYNIKCIEFDVNDQGVGLLTGLSNIDELTKEQNILLFTESCSNPNGVMFDYSLISAIKSKCRSLITVVDNTWLSSAIHNPLDYNTDYVVTSLSKYYSAGTVIAGAIISKFDNNADIMKWISMNGLHVCDLGIQLIIDNIKTIDDRVQKSSTLTLKIIDYLLNVKNSKLKNKIRINHPSFLKNNYITKFPSVFTIFILGYKNAVIKAVQNSKIEFKTSFGSSNSKIDTWSTKLEDYIRIRLSVGYSDTLDNLISKLDSILDSLDKK